MSCNSKIASKLSVCPQVNSHRLQVFFWRYETMDYRTVVDLSGSSLVVRCLQLGIC